MLKNEENGKWICVENEVSTTAWISKSVRNKLEKLISNFTRKYMERSLYCACAQLYYVNDVFFLLFFSSWWAAGNRQRRRRRRCRGVRWARVPCRLRLRRQRRRGSGPQVPAVLRLLWVVPPPGPVVARTVGRWWRIPWQGKRCAAANTTTPRDSRWALILGYPPRPPTPPTPRRHPPPPTRGLIPASVWTALRSTPLWWVLFHFLHIPVYY